jgi:hypothetical protein
VLAQITINKGQYVLAQMTTNNFFPMKGEGQKNLVYVGTNHKQPLLIAHLT